MDCELYEISLLFPDVEEIRIEVKETNAWAWNKLRSFTMRREAKTNFHLECPMSKCLGSSSGIDYKSILCEMTQAHEAHRRVRLSCGGYDGYNLTSHCDWYVALGISIRYRQR